MTYTTQYLKENYRYNKMGGTLKWNCTIKEVEKFPILKKNMNAIYIGTKMKEASFLILSPNQEKQESFLNSH